MTSVIPDHVQKVLDEPPPSTEAEITPPPSAVFQLDGGYMGIDGRWLTEFEVRELTGRDEEALGRVASSSRFILELLERGLVRVGDVPGKDALDGLQAGDWESILLAIRSVTFGDAVDFTPMCFTCQTKYEITVHIREDLRHVALEGPQDLHFEFTGRHGSVYHVVLPTGSTQRKLLQNMELSMAEQNTVLLADCIESVDGRPFMGKGTVLDMPMADRRGLLAELSDRKPGPRLEEVTTLCPSCGAENAFPLSIAALFR